MALIPLQTQEDYQRWAREPHWTPWQARYLLYGFEPVEIGCLSDFGKYSEEFPQGADLLVAIDKAIRKCDLPALWKAHPLARGAFQVQGAFGVDDCLEEFTPEDAASMGEWILKPADVCRWAVESHGMEIDERWGRILGIDLRPQPGRPDESEERSQERMTGGLRQADAARRYIDRMGYGGLPNSIDQGGAVQRIRRAAVAGKIKVSGKGLDKRYDLDSLNSWILERRDEALDEDTKVTKKKRSATKPLEP